MANIVPNVSVTDEEVEEFYEFNKQNYEGDEERSASHILFMADASQSDEEVEK